MKIFDEKKSVAALGEKELIARICSRFGNAMPPAPFGGGDDCALIKKSSLKKNIYATSDAVIFGRHFDSSTSARAAGEKLVKRNISDIAAMGARPFSALTSSIFSKNLSLDWLDEFCEGVGRCAQAYGINLIGGDIASVPNDFFSTHMTLLGHSDSAPLLRTGARAGDKIFVTGELGLSFESGHHLSFLPRLQEGNFLAGRSEVSSCTDVSDGVASDLKNLIPQNSCALLLEDSLPRRSYCGKPAFLREAMCDGEDYELLFTVRGDPSELCDLFLSNYACSLTQIGEIYDSKSFARFSKSAKDSFVSDGLLAQKIFVQTQSGQIFPFEGKGFSH